MNLTVDIGGLRIALDGLGPFEAESRERYRRFFVDGAGHPDLALTIETDPSRSQEPPDAPRVERRGEGRYAIEYGALTAEIDLVAGCGRARLASAIHRVDVDSLLRISTTLLALERDALVVHSSGVRVSRGGAPWALVCFGPSGAGKTTVARSVDPSDVLCDEMILLRADGDRVTASGTPFHGELPVCGPGTLPVPALVQLRQGKTNTLARLSDARAAQALLGSVLFFCRDEAIAERMLGLALRICAGRTYTLTFQRDTHVPTFVANALFG